MTELNNNNMELDRRAGNAVAYENTGPQNEYETIQDPDADDIHTANPGDPDADYLHTANPGHPDADYLHTANPGHPDADYLHTARGGNGVDYENTGPKNEYEMIQDPYEGYRHTADPGAIYTLPEPSTASTGPRDLQPANNPATERPRGEAQHKAVHKRTRCAHILAPVIGMIIFSGILGYFVWKVSKQNEEIIELTLQINVMKDACVCPVSLVRYIIM